MGQRYRAVYREFAQNRRSGRCALFGGVRIRYCWLVYAIDELTRERFFALSMLVHDVDGALAPAVLPGSIDLEFQHALYLHPCPLRDIAVWVDGDVWVYRYLERNVVDGSVYKISEIMQLAPVGHPLLAEQVARMLARCGREIVSNVADRILVPRENVAEVFNTDLMGAARMAFCARAWLTRNGYQTEW